MKSKKLTALLLTGVMGAGLMANAAWAQEEEIVESDTEAQSGDVDFDEDPAELVIALMSLAPIDTSNSDHVEEALNEMLLKNLNIKADFQWYDANTYGNTVPNMITSNEKLDLVMFTPVPIVSYASYMAQNQLMDITDYIDEYGDNIKAVMGDYLPATSKDGKVYGVGNNTSFYATETFGMRKDVLDDLGLTDAAENAATWTELEDILKQVVDKTDLDGIANADAEGSVISTQPYLNGSDKLDECYAVDVLGDSYQYIYADEKTDKVKSYFGSDEFYQNLLRVRQWYEDGVVNKDSATAQDYGDTLIKNGVSFCNCKQTELGSQAAYAADTGYEGVLKEIAKNKLTTGTFQKFGFAVPVTSDEPEAAVKVLNFLYGNQEFMDTLAWGVEGVDWVKNDKGEAAYPDGVTAETAQYHTGDFLYGNRLQVTPWEGSGDNIRQEQAEANTQIEKSKYFGFSVDPTNVSSTLAAVKNVVDQYKPQLCSGSVEDVEGTYKEFMSALDAAGINDVIKEYQSQLDAWLAKQ